MIFKNNLRIPEPSSEMPSISGNMKIGLTGVTGFVGSCLGAAFLRGGQSIVAFSRNDASGQRTRESIQDAWNGLGYNSQSSCPLERVTVVGIDFNQLDPLENCSEFRECSWFFKS